jgi:NADPH-dependent glutamate synthase beta subunit-like oxidoreductase
VTATGGDDGIHSYGTVTISGGTVTAKGNDYGIYAGGDAVTGAATVIKAMGAGKVAAASIDQYLSE